MLGLTACAALAWTLAPSAVAPSAVRSVAMRTRMDGHPRMEFGENDYTGADPGSLPEGVYEIVLRKPLGIQFEEDGPNYGKSGVSIIGLVDGGSAAKNGQLQVGDKLVGVTAVKFIGAKFERLLFDTRKWDFDTVVDAIGSNDEKFNIYDVILQFSRADS